MSVRGWIGALVLLLGWPQMARASEPAAQQQAGGAPYDAKGRRDPFVPLVIDGKKVGVVANAGSHSTALVLLGILWDPGGQSIALIGDTEAKVGDVINGNEVIEIQRDAVVLSNGGERTVLQLQFGAPERSPDSEAGGAKQ